MSGESRPPPGKPAADPAGGADPSMEDILASIRRILNEEDSAAASGAADPAADDALDLSEDMLVSETGPQPLPAAPPAMPAPPPMAPPPPAPVVAGPPVPQAEPELEPEPPTVPVVAADTLLAPAAAAAATASLGTLLRTVAAERSSAVTRGGPTIEDVVREAIRPMLKEWLDQHLPPLVERLVRAEIERVVGRALS